MHRCRAAPRTCLPALLSQAQTLENDLQLAVYGTLLGTPMLSLHETSGRLEILSWTRSAQFKYDPLESSIEYCK